MASRAVFAAVVRKRRSLTTPTSPLRTGCTDETVELQDIFVLERTGIGPRGNVTGRFAATGAIPRCMDRLKAYGVRLPESIFREEHKIKEA